MVSGTLSLGGDLYDVTNGKKIYDGVAGKFEASVMPYEKGDLTSDWASSSYSSGYYEVVGAGNVKSGVAFGREATGTLLPGGTASEADVRQGKTFVNGSWTTRTGTASVVTGSAHYVWATTGVTHRDKQRSGGNAPACASGTVGTVGYMQKAEDSVTNSYSTSPNNYVNQVICREAYY